MYPKWSSKEKNYLKRNINRVPYASIGLHLGRTSDACKQRAHILGLDRHNSHFPRRLLDEDFFKNHSNLSAYWAGFIAADGCLVADKRQELRIGINRRDTAHLSRFRHDVGFDGHIREDKKGVVHLVICAINIWLSDLYSIYQITPSKTNTLKPPRIRGTEALSFIKGYIDGDGCWHRSYGNRLHLIIVGTEFILSWLKSVLECEGADIGFANVRPNRGCYRLSFSGRYAESIAKLLLSVQTPQLERKWKIARGEAMNQNGGA